MSPAGIALVTLNAVEIAAVAVALWRQSRTQAALLALVELLDEDSRRSRNRKPPP